MLGFPVVSRFSHGTYLQASAGIIEVIREASDRASGGPPADPYRPPHKGWLLIEVPDLSEAYRSVVEGAEPLWEPQDRPWRFRDFGVEDPCGNLVCLFCRLPGWEEYH